MGRDGSIDWFWVPRFDSPACFAALLGTPEHGRWLLSPTGDIRRVHRRYRENTLVLETEFETDNGIAISNDGKGRLMDNIFVERLWRSLK